MNATLTMPAKPLASYRDRALFLVWGPPGHGPRSRVFARELGLDEPHFIYATTRRGLLSAPFKYAAQSLQTLALLFRKRPRLVFVQSPPSLAVLVVALYCLLTGGRYVVDAHSAALLYPYWTWPGWLHAALARRAVATIVTNDHFAGRIAAWGGRAFVLRDIPTSFGVNTESGAAPASPGGFRVTVVNTYSPDEPVAEVLQAAAGLDGVQFFVTGKTSRANAGLLEHTPANVRLTDFLPDEAYYGLLSSSDAVMCLTKQDHTMQRGACEALSLGKPIITSDWPLLRAYFNQGTVHVPNTVDGIRQGVLRLQAEYGQHLDGIRALQADQRREWQEKVAALIALVGPALE